MLEYAYGVSVGLRMISSRFSDYLGRHLLNGAAIFPFEIALSRSSILIIVLTGNARSYSKSQNIRATDFCAKTRPKLPPTMLQPDSVTKYWKLTNVQCRG